MKKNHRIKPLGTDGEPRRPTGYGCWQGWLPPTDWNNCAASLGHRPGIYMMRAVTQSGKPFEFDSKLIAGSSGATPEDLHRRVALLQGVLYIGKAVDLASRFGKLAQSWLCDPPTRKHTSVRNYFRKDAAFRQQFPAGLMQLNCMPIGTKDWTQKTLADGLLHISQDWFWRHYPQWTQGHGNSEMDHTCATTIESERSMMCKYRQAFGTFPPLNTRVPNCIGTELDDQLF